MKSPEFSAVPSKLEVSTDLRFVDRAIELHDKVFNEKEQSLYNNKDEWLKRINNGGYFVVFNEGESVKGFTVCDVTSDGGFKIWLAGVDPEARGKGLWSKMYDEVVTYAKGKGYKYILLNTFPKKFPMMFSFLQKMNAEIYKEEQVNGFDKVYARIKI
jgi:ribosomal protein S18 acetylase RimI-like enzyme